MLDLPLRRDRGASLAAAPGKALLFLVEVEDQFRSLNTLAASHLPLRRERGTSRLLQRLGRQCLTPGSAPVLLLPCAACSANGLAPHGEGRLAPAVALGKAVPHAWRCVSVAAASRDGLAPRLPVLTSLQNDCR
ncbi:hypothetical protein HAX54_035681 [Datura stramonium]|uniref:Uncharacterized protein n=1 Tax=Datura stramonium TaxID=4076 RepID=A0ABS8SFJ4_DATST|nr:hypothetical protein [Datura stramonium]